MSDDSKKKDESGWASSIKKAPATFAIVIIVIILLVRWWSSSHSPDTSVVQQPVSAVSTTTTSSPMPQPDTVASVPDEPNLDVECHRFSRKHRMCTLKPSVKHGEGYTTATMPGVRDVDNICFTGNVDEIWFLLLDGTQVKRTPGMATPKTIKAVEFLSFNQEVTITYWLDPKADCSS